ncbi:hypothetical protein NEOKW01_0664 [Nematocida sp. AWRm80]|nr:hypothetical protein NEOKW01_0664 [Nematocida sp. AWRm80]
MNRRRETYHRQMPRRGGYTEFMTEKEKEFVAHLFERNNKRKEKSCPNFYLEQSIEAPETKRKETQTKEEPLFKDVLGVALRKSVKKLPSDQSQIENPFMIKRSITSRMKIEEIYDILNKKTIYKDQTEELSEQEKNDISQRLKEIGEDLFNIDKGLVLLKTLQRTKETQVFISEVVVLLVDRVRYIKATTQFCNYLTEILVEIEKNISKIESNPSTLTDLFITSTSGVIVGHLILILLRKHNNQLFQQVSHQMAKTLSQTIKVSRLFSIAPPVYTWKLLSVASKGMSSSEANRLKDLLEPQITNAMNSRIVPVVEGVRAFLKRCSEK